MLNRVVLVGRLVADPEVRYTPAGVPVAQLRVAVNRITKNENGEYESDFFNVVAWRRTAEFAQNYLSKGRLVSIDGRLQTRSWVDQTSGQKRTTFEIVADNLVKCTVHATPPPLTGIISSPSRPNRKRCGRRRANRDRSDRFVSLG